MYSSGWENGNGDYYNAGNGNVITGQGLKKLPANHVVRKSYEKHFEYRGGDEDISRHSNDQCALHYAIRGENGNYIAYTDGKITLTETGECHWDSTINKKQGHIQKVREDEEIAIEIEALMMGEVPTLDETPPTAPTKLSIEKREGRKVLVWEASEDTDTGSWVVAYHISKNGEFIHMAYGTQYPFFLEEDEPAAYVIRAVNASGTMSGPAILKVK